MLRPCELQWRVGIEGAREAAAANGKSKREAERQNGIKDILAKLAGDVHSLDGRGAPELFSLHERVLATNRVLSTNRVRCTNRVLSTNRALSTNRVLSTNRALSPAAYAAYRALN